MYHNGSDWADGAQGFLAIRRITVTKLSDWRATAFNQATESSNEIHSDEMAQAYGFKGGLVPGVTVSSYLVHPALEAWGMDWLNRGRAQAVVGTPLYDGQGFEVVLADITADSYRAVLRDQEGTENASASVGLTRELPAPPTLRGDASLQKDQPIPKATRAEMEKLQEQGMRALEVRWNRDNYMSTYLKDAGSMPALHNFNGAGYANGAFMLSLTNWVLAGNAYMNPWLHLQVDWQNYAPVADNTLLVAECDIRELYQKKGHEFVDLNVDVYLQETAQPVMTAMLRAIYQLRPAVARA
jgi:hypothetical protein